MKLKLFILTLFITTASFSQNKGTISGVLTDKDSNNETLPFANVLIKGTNENTTTDINGKYSLNTTAGNHIVQFSFIGYESVETPVNVIEGETFILSGALESSSYKLDDVVITTTVNKQKETALLLEQKNAVEIKQSIGAQELARKGVSDVATAVTKTSGITKQEGSGNIFVRGLGDRYNSTTMNGLPLPSNDPSKKNIKLSVFNTDIVESIGIDKTYNFRNFGDFGGANIDIVSKVHSGDKMLELGFELGVNTLAISQKDFRLQDGPSDWGFSSTTYPSDPFTTNNFSTKWNTVSATPINNSIFIRGGNSFIIGENGKLGFFGTASFDNEYNYTSGVSNGSIGLNGLPRRNLTFESFSYSTNTTVMGNVNYKINSDNSLKFNSMFINSSTQDHKEFEGIIDSFDIASDGGGYIRRSNLDQTTLFINQLLGTHSLTERTKLNWGASYNSLKNIIPDRMQNTLIPQNGQSDLDVKQVSDNNDSENHRFYQNLKDNQLAANLSVDYKFKKNEDGFMGKFTLGYNAYTKKVAFQARQFNFDINTAVSQPVVDPKNIDGYFNQTNFSNNLFSIKTFNGGLTPQTYDGEQNIQAAFLGVEYKFTPKLTVVFGTRGEYIIQNIDWFTNISKGANKFDKFEILPTTSIKYEVTEDQNLKFAASKSYTLPQFKERAPFQFEDVTEVIIGNPKLYSSTNYNADIKWEYFPKSSEIISLTGFGKLIQNPINEITITSATNDISYVNSGDKAVVLGAEFEIRKNIFDRDSEKKETLSTGLNASYMYNNQDFNGKKVEDETDLTVFFSKAEGKLTGASDLLLNGDISYFKEFANDKNVLATVTYSYFSDRIYALGTSGRGDLIDKANGTLDFILKSKVSEKIGLGFSVKNILDPTIERFQDKQNVLVQSYKKGINFKVSATYRF